MDPNNPFFIVFGCRTCGIRIENIEAKKSEKIKEENEKVDNDE